MKKIIVFLCFALGVGWVLKAESTRAGGQHGAKISVLQHVVKSTGPTLVQKGETEVYWINTGTASTASMFLVLHDSASASGNTPTSGNVRLIFQTNTTAGTGRFIDLNRAPAFFGSGLVVQVSSGSGAAGLLEGPITIGYR